ncbi:MAG: HlyD family efflux transporter periplasmic adaptor subunit, partial [Clostridiales bacterium]|nr:HlyD family efflux transporter periplasmic adaptor subunit [Clostridiales bacterium]
MIHLHHKKRQLKALALCLMMLMLIAPASAQSPAAASETQDTYSEVTLKKGSITQNVIATGSLRFENEESLALPEALTIESIEVEAGEFVAAGQVLARYDEKALKDSLKEAEDALVFQNETITGLLSGQSSEGSIKTAIAGVVKKLNLDAGQPVQQTLQERPAAIISVDGLMQVSIVPAQPLNLGQEVKIKLGTLTQTGSVARLSSEGRALITFPDTKAEIDEPMQVTLNGFTIGEGKAQVNLPYELYTLMDGVVDSVLVKVNSIVRPNSTLYKIKNLAPSADYERALEDREELYQTILLYQGLMAEPVFLSPIDGIAAEVQAQENIALEKDEVWLRLFHPDSFVLDVAVDELDILSLQTGQEGIATLDALTKAEFPVTVEKIYLLGNTSGGITNYSVSLSIRGDERLRSGMNGTVTLRVGEVSEAVLLPLAALMSDRGGNYVLLKGEGTQSSGIKTYIEVGLSDANFAAV